MKLRASILFSFAVAMLAYPCFADVFAGDNDARLSKNIDVNINGQSVSVALDQLSQTTGISMTAGANNDDWAVRDRKLIMHVTGMPLRDVLREISTVLHFQWTRSGDAGNWTYNLSQSQDQANEERSLRASAQDSDSKGHREKRENAIADMVNLGSLSEADAAKLKASDPWRYLLATEPLGKDVAEFLSSYPDAKDAFLRGGSVTFPISALPTQLQDSVRRVAESYNSLMKSINASEDHTQLLTGLEKLQVSINHKPLTGGDILTQSLLGRITVSSSSDAIEIPVFDPSSPIAKALGNTILKLRSGADKNAVGKQLESDMKAVVDAKEAAATDSRDITSDAGLRTKLKLFDSPRQAALPLVMSEIVEKTNLNIVSDYFPTVPPVLEGGEKSLGELLEEIQRVYGAAWEKSGNLLRFHDKEWFRKRTWEIPQVWIDYWSARGVRNDGLNLDDFAQIAGLRDEQIDNTVQSNTELLRLGAGEAIKSRLILRFYATLSDDQYKAATNGNLMASSLSDDQWNMLKAAVSEKGSATPVGAKGSQYFQFTQSGSDTDIVKYKFSYFESSDVAPVTFELIKGIAYKGAEPGGAKGQ